MIRAPLLCVRLANRSSPIRRSLSLGTNEQLPQFVVPIFNYFSEAYITRAIQAGIEAIHSLDVPWAASFVLGGLAIRLLTAPALITSERLLAKRLRLSAYLSSNMFMKVAERHKIPIVIDPDTKQMKFSHSDPKLNAKANIMIKNELAAYFRAKGLQNTRIIFMRVSTIPFWMFSSFAIRNILTSNFGIGIEKLWWMNNIVEADPYFVLPVAVGLCGLFSIYSQRAALPSHLKGNIRVYDGILALSLTTGVVILAQMPACIALYFLSVSLTGIAQNLLIRKFISNTYMGVKS